MKNKQELELFRFKIIEPFLKKKKKLKDIEIEKNISYATLKRWVNAYKKNGIIGLEKKSREDKNSFRNLNDDDLEKIKEFCKNSSETNITTLYNNCKKIFPDNLSISYATFYRLVNNIDSFFNKTTVKYMETIKKENQCFLVFDIPLYILVEDIFFNKKIVPRLLIMIDAASLEPINFSIDSHSAGLYSLLGFIREGILKVSVKNDRFITPKEILVASKNINNKNLLKEIYTNLGIRISEHYTENSEVQKFIEFIKKDIEIFYKKHNSKITMLDLSHFLSTYIYLEKKEYSFSLNYNVLDNTKYIRELDTFLQSTSRKITDSKIRVNNFLYSSPNFKNINGKNISVKFSPLNPKIVYPFLENIYLGIASINL